MKRPARLRLARTLHPGAWWLWAIGLALAAFQTTQPILLLSIVGVAGWVVAVRRSDAPWALAFGLYLRVGAAIVGLRILFRALLGGSLGSTVLVRLPALRLPDWAAGIELGGVVTLESLLAGFADGLRLAAVLACVGAANSLANPKRLLRSVPRALHDIGAAIVVAVSVAPQIVESLGRVRAAQRLRGDGARGLHRIHRVVVPVLEDALERSMTLAAAMDSRGFGRHRDSRRSEILLIPAGLVGVAVGLYGVLDASAPTILGLPTLVVGIAMGAWGLHIAGSRVDVTRYRPDRFRTAEWVVSASGAVATVSMTLAGRLDPAGVHLLVQPLQWPNVSLLATFGVLFAALPVWAAPPPNEASLGTRPVMRPERSGVPG